MRGAGMWTPSCFLLPPGRAQQLESSPPERLCLAVPIHHKKPEIQPRASGDLGRYGRQCPN